MRILLVLIFVGLGLFMQAQNTKEGAGTDQVHPRLQISNLKGGDFQPRAGGICLDNKSQLYVCTWTTAGSIFKHSGKKGDTTAVRVAAGLAEPLGLQFYQGDLYVIQRQELTRLRDLNNDGIFDLYETIYDDWAQSGNFHELAFGLPMIGEHFFVGLSLATKSSGELVNELAEGRGQIMKINNSGVAEVFATGLNTPSGLSVAMDEQLLVTDQLGRSFRAARLLLLGEGDDAGFHAGTLSPEAASPLLWIPRNDKFEKPGQAILLQKGPYQGQIVFGDVVGGGLARATIEEVNGQSQACLYNFSRGFDAGVFRIIEGADGQIYIGGLDGTGNWGFPRSKRIALHYVEWQEANAFELSKVEARQNGFILNFSEPFAEAIADTALHLKLEQWHYQADGSISTVETISVDSISFSDSRESIFIQTDKMKSGHVVHIKLDDLLLSKAGNMILNPEAWYTLNQIPNKSGPN
ncbi:MAG: hypothetical protein AB8H47_02175 [Bacteroidia bacterium]